MTSETEPTNAQPPAPEQTGRGRRAPVDTRLAPDAQTEAPIVRFSVNLARDSAEILKATAAKKGMTVTDVFRRAIGMMEAIDEEIEQGNDIQSVGRDGVRTRIVFL